MEKEGGKVFFSTGSWRKFSGIRTLWSGQVAAREGRESTESFSYPGKGMFCLFFLKKNLKNVGFLATKTSPTFALPQMRSNKKNFQLPISSLPPPLFPLHKSNHVNVAK